MNTQKDMQKHSKDKLLLSEVKDINIRHNYQKVRHEVKELRKELYVKEKNHFRIEDENRNRKYTLVHKHIR